MESNGGPLFFGGVLFLGGNRCSSKVDSCDSDAEEGYSADYVPEASSPLDVHYDVDMINGNDSLIIGTSNPFNCSLFAGEINLSFSLSRCSSCSGSGSGTCNERVWKNTCQLHDIKRNVSKLPCYVVERNVLR